MKNKERFFIAQVGKSVGLRGDLKLHLHTDFPQQFRAGVTLNSSKGLLTIKSYDKKRGLIHFDGYDNKEIAQELVNAKIYSDEEQTRELCPLKEGEHFWFEIIGSKVVEDGETLGEIKDIQRMLDIDYLFIETSKALQEAQLPSNFLLPYIPRYILEFDSKTKTLYTKDAKDVLEAS